MPYLRPIYNISDPFSSLKVVPTGVKTFFLRYDNKVDTEGKPRAELGGAPPNLLNLGSQKT